MAAAPGSRRPGPSPHPAVRGWTLVLPLKGGSDAKSRLGAGPRVASAIGMDCLDAVLACPRARRVLVVTGDAVIASLAATAGADVVAEDRPGAGLMAAVRRGLEEVGSGPCAVLLADLPAMRPEDLSTALDAVARALAAPHGSSMAFVPDAEGTGTVLVGALDVTKLDPAFGPQSARAHALRGARRLDLPLPRLRRDVDTPADLAAAAALGVGPRTAGALPAIGVAAPSGEASTSAGG